MPTTPMTQKEFVLPIENRPGALADVANALGKANVNVTGYLLQAQGDFGVFRFVTNEPAKTESWLKTTNRPYRTHEVVTVPLLNQPGELGRISTTLSKSGVNIAGSYPAFQGDQPGVVLAVDDIGTARKVLQG